MLLCSCIAQDIIRVVYGDKISLNGSAIVRTKEEFVDVDLLQHTKQLLTCSFVSVITDLFR